MHGNALKAAVDKHGHLKGDELVAALREDPKDYNEEEIAEIVSKVLSSKPLIPDPDRQSGPKVAPGKALYDKWRGNWVAVETITNPFNNETIVVTWRFDRLEAKPNKTNIPLTEEQVRIFNTSRQLEAAVTPTEQLYPAGTTETIYHRKPNPFQAKTIA